MKKWTRWLAAVGMTGALLGCGAALAAESAITVQLDGQELTFTDAVPQVRDQRTFLPFRAVFEAMGAQVSSEGSVITATRDGRTLTMTLNETAATVTDGETVTPITMDVAPYVDSATWRTYVPVRFAAQAFGCAVGWDQENSAAIIVDTEKLLAEALEGKQFTYLEKLMDYSKKYNEGIWDMEATFDANMAVMAVPMTMSGDMKGAVQDSAKMDLDMNMKADLSEFIQSISLLAQNMGGEAEELSPEDLAVLDSLKNEGVDLTMRGDLGTGKLCMNMSGALMEATGMSGEAWYSVDMAALLEQAGMDWKELMKVATDPDYTALVKQGLSSLELNDSVASYGAIKATAEDFVAALSDESFVKEGDQYTVMIGFEWDDATAELALAMQMENGAVTGYAVEMYTEVTENMPLSTGTTTVMEMTSSMDVTISMDDKDQMKAEIHIETPFQTMKMTMNGSYTQGQTAPETEPPAGANVIPLEELLKEAPETESVDMGSMEGVSIPIEGLLDGAEIDSSGEVSIPLEDILNSLGIPMENVVIE